MSIDETKAADVGSSTSANRVREEDSESSGAESTHDSITSENRSMNSVTHSPRDSFAGDSCRKISYIYLLSLCCSPFLLLMDIGTDSYLAFQYYVHEEYTYFYLTIAFVIIPAVVSTMFSIRMYIRDKEQVSYWKWTFRVALLALQISPVMRYLEAFQHAIVLKRNSRPSAEYDKHSALLLKEDSNLALLRILECFLESVPQQVVQITILLTPGRPDMPPILQIYLYLCLLSSFVSTSWTLATYHRSIRFAQSDKAKMTWTATFFQFFWIISIMISRILAVSEAAAIYPRGTLFVGFVHWCVMTVWLTKFEETWFCFSPNNETSKMSKFNEFLFCAVMGLVYLFSFVAVNDEPTRYKYIFYYSVCFLENLSSMVVWFAYDDLKIGAFRFALPIIIFIVFVFGIIMMRVYYVRFHPSMSYEGDNSSDYDYDCQSPHFYYVTDQWHWRNTRKDCETN